ncbi:MAG: OmpA family protein [Coleofasciculaceae cyanobacterium SM2_3_26]|nr:OmpA family protein [Coleofasciculaceae cyanobacterium SM2_3_26]
MNLGEQQNPGSGGAPDPDRIRAEIDRLATLFNSTGTRAIAATFADGQVSVQGLLEKDADASTITQAFERIPGVRRVVLNFQDGTLPLRKRLYFDSGSTDFTGAQESQILDELAQFLKRYPDLQVNVIGHTDPRGGITENRQLARQRAESVRTLLVKRGINAQRLRVQAVPGSPADVGADQPLWQSRCVRFEPANL